MVINLAVSISYGHRMNELLQRCTELGPTAIIPIVTENNRLSSDIDKKNLLKRFRNVVHNACLQSKQNKEPTIPKIYNSLEEFFIESDRMRELLTVLSPKNLVDDIDQLKLIFHPKATKKMSDFGNDATSVTLLTGPESGFSDAEIETAKKYNFIPVSLGPRILSCVSAPGVAMSIAQYKWGDI